MWARVMSLEEIQPDFKMEEELFCQRKAVVKKEEKKKAPKEVMFLKLEIMYLLHDSVLSFSLLKLTSKLQTEFI